MNIVRKTGKKQKAQGLVEYALIIALIAILVIIVLNVFDDPIGTARDQVDELLNPTPTVYPAETLVLEIKNIGRLETVSMEIIQMITADSGLEGIADFFLGDNLVLHADGMVIAGVDFEQLSTAGVQVTPSGVTITMPQATIFSTSLIEGEGKTYVYDRTTGLLTHGDPNLETTARQAAVTLIEQVARDQGIIQTAQINAEGLMRVFLVNLGFKPEEIIIINP